MKKNTKIITVAVIILVCSLLSGCQESSQKAKDTKKQNIIADKQKENSKLKKQLKMRILEKVKLKMIMI